MLFALPPDDFDGVPASLRLSAGEEAAHLPLDLDGRPPHPQIFLALLVTLPRLLDDRRQVVFAQLERVLRAEQCLWRTDEKFRAEIQVNRTFS